MKIIGVIFILILSLNIRAFASEDESLDLDIENLLLKKQKISYNELRKGLIDFSNSLVTYYDDLNALAKSEATKSDKDQIESVEARGKICRKIGSTHNVDLDPFVQAFNYFNLVNDAIITHGTDEELLKTPSGKPILDNLFNAKNVYQLILLQNEHIRTMGFCSEKSEILQLDFYYNVVAVRPNNISELSEATSFILSAAEDLLATFSSTPKDESVIEWNMEGYGPELFDMNAYSEHQTLEL